jgi:small subunit ribosomal protein S6
LANRIYELMYIVKPEATADEVNGVNEAVEKIYTELGGTVVKREDMGLRKLAFPIDKKTQAHYVLFELEGTGKELFELERRLRVNDLVMRFMNIRVDEERKTGEKHRLKREKYLEKRNSSFKSSEPTDDFGAEEQQQEEAN